MTTDTMLLLLLFCSCLSVGLGELEEAVPGQFPHVVSLKLSGLGGHNCAGAVLSPWWVISTGLCAELDDELDHDHFFIVAGEWDLGAEEGTEQQRHVETVFTHPYFSSNSQSGDIALVRLNESLVLGEYVQPVSLARASPAPGSPCVEAGWSQLGGHRKLQWGQTSLMDKQRCVEGGNAGPLGFATQCAGAAETGTAVMCPGYTGSPLICEDGDTGEAALAGLQSYTWACGTQGAPSVYTDIAAIRDWVDFILSKYQD